MTTKTLFAAAIALALPAASAFAADLPSRKEPPVVVAPPPPPPLWTGFYIGVNAGYSWSNSNAISQSYADTLPGGFATNAALGNLPGQVLAPNDGFIGGGQLGFNWQFNDRFVVGGEADIQGLTGGSNSASFIGVDTASSFSRSLAQIGTIRGRLGFLATPTLLVYGTGGFAYGQATLTANYYGVWSSPLQQIDNASRSLVGYAVGGGLEWLFLPNWSVKAEYLYYDLGSLSTSGVQYSYTSKKIAAISTAQSDTRFNGHIVRVGVNYHFSWGLPALGDPWR
jgi:outer membrane immunogenic protein